MLVLQLPWESFTVFYTLYGVENDLQYVKLKEIIIISYQITSNYVTERTLDQFRISALTLHGRTGHPPNITVIRYQI